MKNRIKSIIDIGSLICLILSLFIFIITFVVSLFIKDKQPIGEKVNVLFVFYLLLEVCIFIVYGYRHGIGRTKSKTEKHEILFNSKSSDSKNKKMENQNDSNLKMVFLVATTTILVTLTFVSSTTPFVNWKSKMFIFNFIGYCLFVIWMFRGLWEFFLKLGIKLGFLKSDDFVTESFNNIKHAQKLNILSEVKFYFYIIAISLFSFAFVIALVGSFAYVYKQFKATDIEWSNLPEKIKNLFKGSSLIWAIVGMLLIIFIIIGIVFLIKYMRSVAEILGIILIFIKSIATVCLNNDFSQLDVVLSIISIITLLLVILTCSFIALTDKVMIVYKNQK